MDVSDWVTILGTPLGVLFGGLAAYFAWQTYRRQPTLKVKVDEDTSLKHLRYHYGNNYFGGRIHLQILNVGRMAAHNVEGWLQLDPEYLVPKENPRSQAYASAGGRVRVSIPHVSPVPSPNRNNPGLQPDARIQVNVETKKAGPTQIRYRFFYDEGATPEGSLRIVVPPFDNRS